MSAVRRLSERLSLRALLKKLGPGVITGAADDDPSGIATYSQAGARAGFTLMWTVVVTWPLMVAVQSVSARIGRVTGRGLAGNMVLVFPRGLVTTLVLLLFVANTINLGADLAAMGAAARLMLGGGSTHLFTIAFAVGSLLAVVFVPYHRYVGLLKWFTFSLLAYVGVVFSVKIDWQAVATGILVPRFDLSGESLTLIVAVFGTTISPYLFFWQSAQEVEEVDQDKLQPLLAAPDEAEEAISRIRLDTVAGMLASNLIALAIMIATAATLHKNGITNIETSADAAQALKPIAGSFAFALFALGIIGTGLLAIPVLAGSAGYAIAEALGWKTGLDNMPWQARGFYAVIGAAVLLGLGIGFADINPIEALYWSAVLNGLIAVPMMVALMLVACNRKKMGAFCVGAGLRWLGWLTTAVMGAAAITMLYVTFR